MAVLVYLALVAGHKYVEQAGRGRVQERVGHERQRAGCARAARSARPRRRRRAQRRRVAHAAQAELYKQYNTLLKTKT